MRSSGKFITALALGLVALTPSPAFAYLDAGTGSMIIQLIVGAFVGGMVFLKFYWYRFKAFLTGTSPEEREAGDNKERSGE